MPTETTPHTRWNDLPVDKQFAIARHVIQRRMAEWKKHYPGVIGIGFGVRHSKKQRREADPLGIIFFVERKGLPIRGIPLPRFVFARPRIQNKIVTFAIPTDVVGSRNCRLHAPPPPVTSYGLDGVALILGDTCCPLATSKNGSAVYILGCNHVFLASENNPGLAPSQVSYVGFQLISVGGIAAGSVLYPGNPPTLPSKDAALARIDNVNVRPALKNYWSWNPLDIARGSVTLSQFGAYALYPVGTRTNAQFMAWQPNQVIPVGGGQSILLSEALLYTAPVSPGMSGCAFADVASQIILGMHTAGFESDDVPGTTIGVAQPLWTLVNSDGPFAQNLYLGSL